MKRKFLSCLLAVFISLSFVFPVFSSELYPDMFLVGHTSLLIPEVDKSEYNYTACYLSADGSLIPTEDVTIDVSELPDGVTFDIGTGIATVYDYAEEGDSFTVTITPPSSQPKLHIKKYTLTLNYNHLINGDFTSYPSGDGWDTRNSSPFSLKNGTLTFDINEETNATYLLTQENKIPMDGDTLYECSFDIKTFGLTDPIEELSLHSEIIGESAVCYVDNPHYPEWTSINIPIRCDDSGNFLFSLAITPENAALSISIKNLTLKKAYERPSSIYASIPQSFSVPKTEFATTPLNILVLDQEGEAITADISYEISPRTEEVKIENEILTVTNKAVPGEYTAKAYLTRNPGIYHEFTIRITESGIDNGDFESDHSENSWIASGDGEYSIVKDNRNSYAAFTPNNIVGVMYNNAFVSFEAQQSYVFKADLKTKYSDSEVFVTFIIEDKDNPDNLILCAYFDPDTSWNTYKAVFTPEDDINGRFIVATNIPEGSDDQILYLDNIEVVPAIISAENVKIRGTAQRGKTLKGTFDFLNNFDGESATVTNWALAPSSEGPYTTLSYSNVPEIEITEDMEGFYIRFEVTPISLTAGIVGETVYSAPLKVQKKRPNITFEDSDDENNNSVTPEEEKTPLKDNPAFITPLKIVQTEIPNPFTDTVGHWAENDIALLSGAGVAAGYSDNTFAPEKQVSRAEFCAFLMRSLGLEGGIYSGIYSDVSPQSWYAGVIQTMYNCKIISGIDENNFAPNAPITREQLVSLLIRAYNLVKTDSHIVTANLPWSDCDKISPYALTDITKAYSLGLISGDSEGMLNPQAPATRAEAITLLTRFLSAI